MIAAKAKEPGKAKAEAPGQKAKQKPASPQKPAFNPLWERLALGVQAKLAVSAPDDPYEKEADRVADQVLRMPEPRVQRECTACEEEQEKLSRKESGNVANAPTTVPPVVQQALSAPGQPLDPATRGFFEPRFGHDFSRVRVHADGEAATAARAVRAWAYTTGRDIVFGAGQYATGTDDGRRLLAHELAHVVQQDGGTGSNAIQRCPDAATDTQYDNKVKAVKAHTEYGKLLPPAKAEANKIVTDAKSRDNCIYYVDKLKLLFDTPEATAAATTKMFQATTSTASAAETKRMATAPAQDRKNVEEQAVRGAVFTKKPGKFGGGNYEVDARDPLNILIRAKVLLTKKGTGTDGDVNAIKGMEDAIEKAASTKGYIVDVVFVNVADADTFKVDVDPSKWEVATNWSGGNPTGFAHELHHMFAFPLDRYDYIESHATNKDMKIPARIHWFSEELTKPANYNNPASIMSVGAHPLDDDTCIVAGLNVATCVTAREKVNKMYQDITAAYTSYDDQILNCISKNLKSDPDTMMAVLRELFRQMVASKTDRERILKRGKDATDAFGKVFQTITAAQQTELLGIITI